ncbi:MAG: hypothetical protein QM657_15575 [Lacrimispora sp.]|uniref:hypothetical protein n=1 Tax=Lacrimispora sp. TaxID=2719234 RepID=UPI0039E27035
MRKQKGKGKGKRMRKGWKRVTALVGIISLMNVAVNYAGIWEQQGSDWLYLKADGQYAKEEWIQDSDGSWYYIGRFGEMKTNRSVDGYYLGADGKMLSEMDTASPLYGEKIYGTCYIKANSYRDCGDYYVVNVSLYDSSFGTNNDLGQYNMGDKFWIESEHAYGMVKNVTRDTGGSIALVVIHGSDEYTYTAEYAHVLSFSGDGEGPVLRKIKDSVEVTISKNVEIVPVQMFYINEASLNDFLNNNWYKLVPIFEGSTVKKAYDDMINHAG